MRCVIVVPTYNEATTIVDLLGNLARVRAEADQLLGATIDVLVVDDNSPDGTATIIRSHPGFGDWLQLLSRQGKEGLGAAYRAGFAFALAQGCDAIVQLDADGSHPTDAIPSMLARLETHDVVIGSRYVRGGRTQHWPVRRRALSRAANAYARLVLGLRTRDTTSGFRAWRARAVNAAGLLHTTSSGYGFQVENTWHCERLGLRLWEHPITFTERTAGSSKMDLDVALEAVRLIMRWRLGELAGNLDQPPRALPRLHARHP